MKTEDKKKKKISEDIRTNPPKNMSVDEAARYIGISPRSLRNFIYAKKIKAIRFGGKGGRLILRLIDVDRFIESNLVEIDEEE